MQSLDLVRFSLTASDGLFNALVNDLRDHPTATPSKDGTGNHALWTIGHVTFWEARIPAIVDGGANPLEPWAPLFATGSTPSPDASLYPSFDELMDAYRTHRATLMKLISDAGEAGMGRVPTNIPPGFGPMMSTLGQTAVLMAMHQMHHAGELADIRRAVGVKPLL